VKQLRPHLLRLSAAALAVGLLAASCGSDGDGVAVGSDVDAVSIGGQSLSRSQLDDILDGELSDTADGNHTADAVAGFLGQYIFAEAVAAELGDHGFPVTDEAVAAAAEEIALTDPEFDAAKASDQYSARLSAIGTAFDDWIASELPAADIDPPEYMCASHILVETEPEALAIGDRLAEGEGFADLAVELSTGPSGPGGGDLGCAQTAGYVVEFTEGAREVTPSGVTGPVQSDFGWHVIEVRSFGPLTADNHPEVDPAQIEGELANAEAAGQQGLSDPLIAEIQDAALVRIAADLDLDPRYGTWDDALGVVPPDGITEPGSDVVPDLGDQG
jgi:peptidyl-prolyl cis-trans isomerase C